MKAFKKLVASAGIAAGLLGASQPASATLSLIFFDEFFNEVVKYTAPGNSLNVSGQFLGWNVVGTVSTSGAPNNASLTFDGTAYRANVFSDTANCTNVNNIAIPVSPFVITVNNFSAAYGCGNTTPNSGLWLGPNAAGLSAANQGVLSNNVLRMRLEETNFNPMPGGGSLNYSLTSSRFAGPGDGGVDGMVGGQVYTEQPGTNVDLAPIVLNNTSSLVTSVAVPPTTSTRLYVRTGIDLIPDPTDQGAGSQSDQRAFQWNLTVRQQIPEPGTIALLGLSLIGIAVSRRKSKKVA